MQKSLFTTLIVFLLLGLTLKNSDAQQADNPYIIVLGIAQDGGYPHLGCQKKCCKIAWENPERKRFVVSLALVDPIAQKWYLFEATPDMADQIQYFREITNGDYNYLPEAIFVSHAHIGHYTGLMEFGREAMNSREITVYALPRMKSFLEENGPWSQLVSLKNIVVEELSPGEVVTLSENISVYTDTVPHRYEFSETASYKISTSGKNYLFIPDIDKWDRWDKEIISEVKSVDIAFIDGTFYTIDDLPGRDIGEIPHPFITETIKLFGNHSPETKKKVHFIHLNHSNPVLWNSKDDDIRRAGFNVAQQGKKY